MDRTNNSQHLTHLTVTTQITLGVPPYLSAQNSSPQSAHHISTQQPHDVPQSHAGFSPNRSFLAPGQPLQAVPGQNLPTAAEWLQRSRWGIPPAPGWPPRSPSGRPTAPRPASPAGHSSSEEGDIYGSQPDSDSDNDSEHKPDNKSEDTSKDRSEDKSGNKSGIGFEDEDDEEEMYCEAKKEVPAEKFN